MSKNGTKHQSKHIIPGHVLEKNTRNLYTFFSFLFQQKIRPHGRLCGRLCRTRAFCVQRLSGPQCYLSSNKNDGPRGHFNCISTVSCKGSVCVEVLTSFYDRFFFEEEQFIKYTPSTSSLHLGSHFFHLSTPPRFGALILPEVNQFTGNCFPIHCTKNWIYSHLLMSKYDANPVQMCGKHGKCRIYSHIYKPYVKVK